MQSHELLNLSNEQNRQPECLGRTILAFPVGSLSAGSLLDRVKDVWKTVADWGTWRDETLGEWPSDDECAKRLPDWFRLELERHPTFSLQAWISDLHDRDWIWWSGRVVDGWVKIDLDSQSLPISTWMLEAVVESTGGKIVYRDNWISDDAAIAMAASKKRDSDA